MKASFFASVPYVSEIATRDWPAAPALCDRETGAKTMNRAMEQALLAEDLGFDWVSVSEHHYSPRILTPSPMIFAAALTQRLKRARIALLGPLLPLTNPIRVAEELAMLDAMSEGRVIVLFLRGTPNEILTYRNNPDESREMTQEGVELILRAWTEPQPFGWEGRYFNYRTVSVWPRTVQEPHPKVFTSGNSPDSVRFAARHHIGLAMSFLPLSAIKQRVEMYREEAAKEGWQPTEDDVLYRFFAHVAESDAEAEKNIGQITVDLRKVFNINQDVVQAVTGNRPEMREIDRPFLCGGPATVVDQVGELRECGVGNMDLSFTWPGVSYQQQLRSMECVGKSVLPQIRGL
jgi:alkanesulfonate monooxygenase SsuD/methylene tetrahydromethanopterin reductase-like flavin-dependent oxidoreductase (luciferase family)